MFAWELGGGLGHLARMAPLAAELTRRGVLVLHAVRDLQGVADAPWLVAGHLLQAPLLSRGLWSGGSPASYAELLLHAGYGNPATLTALLRAWRTLLEQTRAEVLIADHAPTALLAARVLGIPVIHCGDGFTIPPPGQAFDSVARPDPARLRSAEARVLETVNQVLAGSASAPLQALPDLLAAQESVLATYAELDHYHGASRAQGYAGHFELRGEEAEGWMRDSAPRVLAYLKPTAPHFARVVAALEQLPWQARIYAGGYVRPPARSSGPGVLWSATPISMTAVAACDMVVCHAGHGLTCTALLAGRPLLLLPEMMEQWLTARNVERMGAGLSVHSVQDERKIRRSLVRLLDDASLRDSAGAFARKYAAQRAATTVWLAELADRVSALATHDARA